MKVDAQNAAQFSVCTYCQMYRPRLHDLQNSTNCLLTGNLTVYIIFSIELVIAISILKYNFFIREWKAFQIVTTYCWLLVEVNNDFYFILFKTGFMQKQ